MTFDLGNGSTNLSVSIAPSPCESDPCGNNGGCVSHITYFICTCINGYTGQFCEERKYDAKSGPYLLRAHNMVKKKHKRQLLIVYIYCLHSVVATICFIPCCWYFNEYVHTLFCFTFKLDATPMLVPYKPWNNFS